SFDPLLPRLDNPVSAEFCWTPTLADTGDHVVTFTVDDVCHTRTCDFTIRVNRNPEEPLTIRLVSPNGGDSLIIGVPSKLSWAASGGADAITVDFLLSRNGAAGPFETITLGVPNSGSYLWTPMGPATAGGIIRILAHSGGQP